MMALLPPQELLRNGKANLTPLERRAKQIARLKASLIVPQHTSIGTPQHGKQKPTCGAFASI